MTRRNRIILICAIVVGVPAIGVGALWVFGAEHDPCITSRQTLPRLRPDNPYLHSCDGKIYLISEQPDARYKRLDKPGVDLATLKALPLRFAAVGQQLYYVSMQSEGFYAQAYDLRPIPEADVATLEIRSETMIRDKNHEYVVNNNQYTVEPRTEPSAAAQ
jgi:hypothetical protein